MVATRSIESFIDYPFTVLKRLQYERYIVGMPVHIYYSLNNEMSFRLLHCMLKFTANTTLLSTRKVVTS